MSEDEEGEDDSDADGFVVPNGYMSDDEGVASAQASLDAISGDLSEGVLLFLPCVPGQSLVRLPVCLGGVCCAQRRRVWMCRVLRLAV